MENPKATYSLGLHFYSSYIQNLFRNFFYFWIEIQGFKCIDGKTENNRTAANLSLCDMQFESKVLDKFLLFSRNSAAMIGQTM